MSLIFNKDSISEKEFTMFIKHMECGFDIGHSIEEHNDLYDDTGRCILCLLGMELMISEEERL